MLAAFHLPLTATTLLTMSQFPVTAAALERGASPTLMLASWQIAVSLMFLMRTIVFALPEVVITLARDVASARKLRDFCVRVGAFATCVLLLLAVSGADVAFFRTVLGAKPEEASLAHLAFYLGALTPFIGAAQSYVRGMLTQRHLTAARLWAIVVGMGSLAAMLALGLWLGWLGVVNASVALTVSMVLELATLAWFWRRRPGSVVLSDQSKGP
jgi:hypothetical protein